jgi:uncharacterized protein YggE
MRKFLFAILLLAAAPLFAQLESHTLTITANRSLTLQPDQVVFSLAVDSSLTTTLDQVLATLSSLGITSASLTGVSNQYAGTSPPPLEWDFTLSAPIANLAATIGSLTKLQQNIGQNNSGLTLTFNVQGMQVSQQLQQSAQSQACSNSALIADATPQAQQLATAAGATLGSIIKLSNVPQSQNLVAARVGVFAAVGYIVPANYFSASQPVTCSLVVQFQLVP